MQTAVTAVTMITAVAPTATAPLDPTPARTDEAHTDRAWYHAIGWRALAGFDCDAAPTNEWPTLADTLAAVASRRDADEYASQLLTRIHVFR